jgi:hypothetical protein
VRKTTYVHDSQTNETNGNAKNMFAVIIQILYCNPTNLYHDGLL